MIEEKEKEKEKAKTYVLCIETKNVHEEHWASSDLLRAEQLLFMLQRAVAWSYEGLCIRFFLRESAEDGCTTLSGIDETVRIASARGLDRTFILRAPAISPERVSVADVARALVSHPPIGAEHAITVSFVADPPPMFVPRPPAQCEAPTRKKNRRKPRSARFSPARKIK